MSAQSASEPGWDGPAEILALLPQRCHEQFLSEYRAALEAARDVRRWRLLADLLSHWRLRALAYSDPGFDAAARDAPARRPDPCTRAGGLAVSYRPVLTGRALGQFNDTWPVYPGGGEPADRSRHRADR